jgi:hypothetical protein
MNIKDTVCKGVVGFKCFVIRSRDRIFIILF